MAAKQGTNVLFWLPKRDQVYPIDFGDAFYPHLVRIPSTVAIFSVDIGLAKNNVASLWTVTWALVLLPKHGMAFEGKTYRRVKCAPGLDQGTPLE
jgi:hypothetical protein